MARLIEPVVILGGGPAGASAAIAARTADADVSLIEKSKFPRHKVCGEFFSPEIEGELSRLGAWDAFRDAGPARIRSMKLHFARRSKVSTLPEPAWGLSRYAFDSLLLDRAVVSGARLSREPISREPGETPDGAPRVVAWGRSDSGTQRGRRLFGFKAHFTGPVDDAVELFFFEECYVGVNMVEGGRTNVCGLGPEDYLRKFDFDFDRVTMQSPALARRLAPLTRVMKWISTGPLRYGQRFDFDSAGRASYPAGDALSFVDPFTGSGILAAVKTGALAGTAAARRDPVARYLNECRANLKKPFEIAAILRKAVSSGWADRMAGMIPGRMLFALTRPGR